MRTPSKIFAAVCLAALACKAPAATVEVHATVTNFRYELIDLTPGDGLSPWIRFDWLPSPKATLFYDPDYAREYAHNDNRDYAPVLLQRGPDVVRGQVAPGLVTLDLSITEGSVQAYIEHIASYSVSPNTRFIFNADATLSSSAPPGPHVYTWAGMSGMFMSAPDAAPLSFEGGSITSPGSPVSGTVSVSAASGTLEGSGVLFLGANAIISSLAPVPEPGRTVSLLAGLLFLGIAIRQRH